jgi:hypothetical protein
VRFDYIFRSMDGGWRVTADHALTPAPSRINPVIADLGLVTRTRM